MNYFNWEKHFAQTKKWANALTIFNYIIKHNLTKIINTKINSLHITKITLKYT